MKLREPQRIGKRGAASIRSGEALARPAELRIDLQAEAGEAVRLFLVEKVEKCTDQIQKGISSIEFASALGTLNLLFPDQPVEFTQEQRMKIFTAMESWLKRAKKDPEDFAALDRYVTVLESLWPSIPEARQFAPAKVGVLSRLGLKQGVSPDWQFPKEQVPVWLKIIEEFNEEPSISPRFLFICHAVLILASLAPDTKPKLRQAVERFIQKIPSQTLLNIDTASRFFPMIVAFPDLKKYFPIQATDIPSLHDWWIKEARESPSVETFNSLTKSILMGSADEVYVVDGKVKFSFKRPAQTAVPLPIRPAI